MKLEEIIERVVHEGVEMWDIASLVGPLVYSGVMIDDRDLAKELKRMSREDKEGMQLLYDRLNTPLFVIERYTGRPRSTNSDIVMYMGGKEIYFEDVLAAKKYMLSKKKTVTFKKVNEYDSYMYKFFLDKIAKKGTGCYHKESCPVSYLDKWYNADSSV